MILKERIRKNKEHFRRDTHLHTRPSRNFLSFFLYLLRSFCKIQAQDVESRQLERENYRKEGRKEREKLDRERCSWIGLHIAARLNVVSTNKRILLNISIGRRRPRKFGE